MKSTPVFATIFLFFYATTPAGAFTLSRFETPESFLSDPEDGTYYVSNVNGPPLERDGNGYISKISPNGVIVIQKFIGGKPKGPLLNAPKGLAVVGRTLFVADIDVVRGFDKKTREATVLVDLSKQGAKFLNDLAHDGAGRLYVSDLLANRIFKIDLNEGYETTIYKDSPQLGNPNGLAVNPKTKNLMVVTWESGQILEIDRSGHIHTLKRGLTTLDGLDYDAEGNLYVSSFEKGEVYKVSYFGRGTLSTFLSGLMSPADISFDRRRRELLIPSFKGNSVSTYRDKPLLTPEK